MKLSIVLNFDVPTPEAAAEILLAIDPPKLPYFVDSTRVVPDPFATDLETWLDSPLPDEADTSTALITIDTPAGLRDLLEVINERGEEPTIAVLTVDDRVVLAYGIDAGDTMEFAYLADPGEDRERGDLNGEGEGSYITPFEGDLDELRGPFTVLHAGTDALAALAERSL